MVKPSGRGPMVEHLERMHGERNAGRAGFYAFHERHTVIGAASIHERSCGCVPGRLCKRECATDIARSAFC